MRVPFRVSLVLNFFFCSSSAFLLAQTDPPAGIPRTVTICDKVQQFEACADWVWNGKDFDYKYSKASGTGTIARNGPSEVILRRTDSHATWPIKRGEVEYFGSFDTNHSGHGSSRYIFSGQPPLVGTWTASFAPVKAVEPTLVEPTLAPPPAAGTPPLAIPVGFEECEGDCSSSHGNIGAWMFKGMKGDAHWSQGNAATLTIERFDVNGVVIRREDLTTSRSAGQTGRYVGRLTDGRAEGIATLKWFGPNSEPMMKQIPWFATIPVTSCDANTQSDDAMQFGGQAAAFRQMSSAFQCFLVAANSGNGRAKTLVGLMYRDGKGTKTNYGEAVTWLKAGAVQGDHDAQLALQQMYELGVGVNADPVQAAKWKHSADTNPLVIRQVQIDQDAKETKQLMFMGLTSILSAAVSPSVYFVP